MARIIMRWVVHQQFNKDISMPLKRLIKKLPKIYLKDIPAILALFVIVVFILTGGLAA